MQHYIRNGIEWQTLTEGFASKSMRDLTIMQLTLGLQFSIGSSAAKFVKAAVIVNVPLNAVQSAIFENKKIHIQIVSLSTSRDHVQSLSIFW
jgi:hypothetical protein